MSHTDFLFPNANQFWREFYVISNLDLTQVCNCMEDSLRLPRSTFFITSRYQIKQEIDFVAIEVTVKCGQFPLKFEIFDMRLTIEPLQAYMMIFDVCEKLDTQIVTEHPLDIDDPYSYVIFDKKFCKTVELNFLEEDAEECIFIENIGDALFTRDELYNSF